MKQVTAAGAAAAAGPANGPAPKLNEEARQAAAALSTQSISPVLVAGFTRLIDLTIVILTGLVVSYLYVQPEGRDLPPYVVTLLGGGLVTVIAFQLAGSYRLTSLRTAGPNLARVVVAWTMVFLAIAVAVFLAKAGENLSRVWFVSWYAVGLAAFAIDRIILASMIRRWTRQGLLERRAVIVGGGPAAEQLIRQLDSERGGEIRICGIFDDRGDDRSPRNVLGYPKLGTIAELVEFGRLARVDLLIVTLPVTAEERVAQLLQKLWVLPVDIRLATFGSKLRFRPRNYSYVGSVPVFAVFDKPIADWDLVAKWMVDHIIGGLILLLAAPVMALVAVAIKLDSKGPVLFRQKRYGFNNELIEVFKFRSMYVDQADADAARLVTKGDPRVTPVGRFIRKTSLDELPQLFNVVFKGNLSLVGPRPHAVQAKASNRLYNDVVDGYFARHRVKPGITGWAQVNGWRGETDTEDKIQHRVECDLHYIENWSVLFDLYIIFLTPFRLLGSENAY